MKKKLDTSRIVNELRGASPFFPKRPLKQKQPAALEKNHATSQEQPLPSAIVEQQDRPTTQTTANDTVIPRNHDTTVSGYHDTKLPEENVDAALFERVRKAVKQIGKEAATHRFTLEEKNLLADIEYTYKRQGIRTSENEVTRIAINYIAEEYKRHGETSILAKILKKLNE